MPKIHSLLTLALLANSLVGQDRSTAVQAGRELYRAHCNACHGPEGDSVPTVDLRRGQFRRVSSDEELSRLILSGVPGTAMPPTNLPEASRSALVAFVRSLHAASQDAAGPGDLARGKSLFQGKGGCTGCHRAGGTGSRVGPDLSDIGSARNAASLERSIREPGETILPQHRYVRAVTREGTEIVGRRLNEDTHIILLIDNKERLVSLNKSDLREFSLLKNSAMPSYQGKFSSQEIADVVTYLLSLKGSQ